MSHTKGPWFVGSMNDALFIIDRKPDHFTDSGVREGGDTIVIASVAMLRHPQATANANVLAAAPQLLDVCRHLVSVIEQLVPEPSARGVAEVVLVAARDVIASAGGAA